MAYDRSGREVEMTEEAGHAQEKAIIHGNSAGAGEVLRGGHAAPSTGNWVIRGMGAGFIQRLKVLPVLIFMATLLFTVKITSLWEALNYPDGLVSITTYAEAEQSGRGEGDKVITEPSPSPDSSSLRAANKTQIAQAKKAKPETKKDEKPLDPVLFTRSEIELLQELSKRRKELDARERTVIQREGLLTAAENRLDQKIAELEGVKKEIEGLIMQYDEQEAGQLKELVAIYEKMKPKDASRIFNELDIEILLKVFDQMKASKSASILAGMRPERAKEITSRIMERREMPKIN
ncbi:MAG: hypothetical protein CMM47_09985 [Rhodospirillaceae bacterium]|nr:hypothetical protein [Rhodospirillaceae bacterium]